MKPTTLCFPVNARGELLLGMKKRGFGRGKYNGFGGKIDDHESFRDCAVRELFEEVSLLVKPEALEPIAYIDFRFPHSPELTHIGYVYIVRDFLGMPLESEEMAPQWFTPNALPYDSMWAGDRQWLPELLAGKKLVGHVTFGPDNESVESMDFTAVPLITEVEHRYEETWPQDIVTWFDANRRDLPWRENKDPYRIWVSEVMLQQTRVEAVKPYFDAWMRQFPTLADVAAADEETVLRAWQGLGYYSRARNLQKGMRTVMNEHNGIIPRDRKTLERIHGIGAYTAGAITSIGFNQREAAVDGNVLRIYARIYNLSDDILSTAGKKRISAIVASTLPVDRPGDFNEALMDFGSAICIPKHPRCQQCPISSSCGAHAAGRAHLLPIRSKKKPQKERTLACYAVRSGSYYLLHKRPSKGVLRDMWEFPTWESATGSTESPILQGADTLPPDLLAFLESLPTCELSERGQLTHIFTHIKWHMTLYGTAIASEALYASTREALTDPHSSWRWVNREDFATLPWAGPHGKLTTKL